MLRIKPSLKPLSISEAVRASKALLEGHLPLIALFGEVGSVTYQKNSGHVYFCLKDSASEIKCVMFKFYASRLSFTIQKGAMLLVQGKATLYEARGEFQIQVQHCEIYDGDGLINRNLEKLKKELEEKGYFKQSNKKPLPPFVYKIALVTSSSGAVIHDMRSVAESRWKHLQLILIPTVVQGEQAPRDIAQSIALADTLNADVIVVGRGGGSLEDLAAFNDKIVADAIFFAKTPIVSAVGHDIDAPISDFVADVRAPTPSAAMEIILPDQNEWLQRLDSFDNNLKRAITYQFQAKKQKLHTIKKHFLLVGSKISLQNHYNRLRYAQKVLFFQMTEFLQQKHFKLVWYRDKKNSALEEKIVLLKKQLFLLRSRLCSFEIEYRLKQRRQYITGLYIQMNKVFEQKIYIKQQLLREMRMQIEILNPEILFKKGFASLWYQDKQVEIKDIDIGNEFIISDSLFKARVKLLDKEPIRTIKGSSHE